MTDVSGGSPRINDLKGLRWPIGLLVVGVVMYLASFGIMRWHEWTPLTMPVELTPGVVRSPSFQIDQPVQYWVELEVDRKLPLDDLSCLLGLYAPPKGCGTVKSVVDISWRLATAERTVASGSSNDALGGGAGPTITRSIGRFKGARATPYVLEIQSALDGRALAPANPRVVVRVNTETYAGYLIIAQLFQFAAIAIGIGALIWFLVRVWRIYVSRKNV